MWDNILAVNGYSTAPSATRANTFQAWNIPIDYTTWEYKLDIKGVPGDEQILKVI